MKRILLMVVAGMMFAAPIMAQDAIPDKDAIRKRIEKSNANIKDAKKAAKANTWIDRGNVFFEASYAISQNIYIGVPVADIVGVFGKPASEEAKKVGRKQYTTYVYPDIEVFIDVDGKVAAWNVKTHIAENELDEAVAAYEKAYELDNRTAARTKDNMQLISDAYKMAGANFLAFENYDQTAVCFDKAYKVSTSPILNTPDAAAAYNAGYLYTIAKEFDKGLPLLQDAEKLGYEANGDLYYNMFFCYYYSQSQDVDKAKEVLFMGLEKYPDNDNIVEGLMSLYTATGDDPQEIIPILEKSINDNPENGRLWGGLGRFYDKLGNREEAIKAYSKAIELMPDDFRANFNLGLLYTKIGDEETKAVNSTMSASPEEFKSALEAAHQYYFKAIPVLEKAHSLEPKEPNTVELLKGITFILREDDNMQAKYDQYNALLNTLK
jgi:tetratricopeptide (TPR) repeat protein